ncbi:MAG: SusC/RagA family TonB-linked outer membrane protein [Prevotellaceae bacterium]|jgi:TonB-linked SusC/RagA family outer membrane protein|nr:SusC/RagA family TonB-linked outer membrane protein [Prevotellaceae bacterium]
MVKKINLLKEMLKTGKKLLLFFLLFGISVSSFAQTKTITGTVTDETNSPVVGASVFAKGTTSGAFTDLDGKFSLAIPENVNVIVVSSIGYTTTEAPASNGVKVTLTLEVSLLNESVVTALGISREKKALGYGVTTVDGDEMTSARGGLNNPINALQGKVAGLQIASSSGAMGGSSKILIRGNHSISGSNQPLFVINGVPVEGKDYNSTETARGGGGYDYGNLIQDINSDDIESVSVLKGANASALYGSRATNGVILITTKKGAKGEGYGVTFNSSVGFEVVNKLPKLQRLYGGGYDFEEVTINGKTYNYPGYDVDESWGPKYEGQEVLSWYDLAKWEAGGKVGNPTTSKWLAPENDIEKFFETGVSYTNNISIEQGNDRNAVRVSYTNSNLKGYLPNSALKKNIFNVAASLKSEDKKFEIFTNISYLNTAAKGRSETGYGDNNQMVKFVQWGHRELDLKQSKDLYIFPDGTQATWNRSAWDDPTPAYSNNPYWSRYMNYENDTRNRVYGNVGLNYQILPELKFQYKVNLDFFVDKQYERNAVYSQEISRYKEISRQRYELNNEFLLLYNKTFGDWSVFATLGGNLRNEKYEYVYGETSGGLAIPLFYNLKNSVSPAQAYNTLNRKTVNSIFGNATVGWKSLLYLDVSVRNDWSSTLPNGNNSYIYPSLTGSFIFSQLTKESLPWLSFGKLRAGYAFVGNDTDPYQIIDTYSQYTNIDTETGTPGYILPTTLKNMSLKPESTGSLEFGIEANFFNNRLGFDFTYYSTESKNQVIPLSVSGSAGYLYRVINAGLITNKGIELSLYGTPVKTNDFEWVSTLTFASNKNKVVEIIDDTDYYRLVNAPFKVEVGAIKGEAYGVLMGTDYIYDDKGNKVVGSDGTYLYTNGNVNLGNVFPDFTGGWSNTFRYKNFDLSILLDFSKGGHYFSTSYMWGMYSGMLEESAANGIRENGIVLPGVTGNVQYNSNGTYTVSNTAANTINVDAESYGASYYTGPAAQSVFKSDYIKLREINIGYTIPLSGKQFVKSLRLSAYGRNLAIWGPDTKHFDPETFTTNSGNIQGIEGGAIPGVASFGVNVSLKF